MPDSKRRPRRPNGANGETASVPSAPVTTGRFIALLRDTGASKALSTKGGLKVARASDFNGSVFDASSMKANEAIVLEEIGVAIMTADPERASSLRAAAAPGGEILVMEPERIVQATQGIEYFSGYRDAVNSLVAKMTLDHEAHRYPGEARVQILDLAETRFTWGLEATKVSASAFTGKGARVAILDTGLDLKHPAFHGRVTASESFVKGAATAQDGDGHGTHCSGTACGPRIPPDGPRYGIASGAELFIGKVLDDDGFGGDGSILAGINWAIKNKCHIISMSLGGPAGPISEVYETTAGHALQAGILIIAAAGNRSRRPVQVAPVDHPANCPSIMAVAAVDRSLGVAGFSNAGLFPNGGKVDLAGPGVDILSAAPMPGETARMDGTSMATPHVAGIAALWIESNPQLKGAALWARMQQMARPLTAPSADVGAGLVQAP